MPISGVFDKKKDSLAKRVLDFYEDTRYNFLSAKEDFKTYGTNWKKSIKKIREDFDGLNEFSTEMKKYLDEKLVFDDNVKDATSVQARELFKQIKEMRFNSQELNDPFAKQMGEDVIRNLIKEPHIYAKFVHYALRSHNASIPEEAWIEQDLPPDTITDGVAGLDLAVSDIPLYIIEHYGDDKDTKRIKPKFKQAMELLKKVFMVNNDEEKWNKLIQLELKKEEKKEKSEISFIVPNKPMYRIFEINDIKELKGFSGEWLVQEKYDGIRIQIHKMNSQIKIFTYNEKDITEKCKDIADKLKAKHFGDVILDAELILYDKDEPLHRADTIAHLFKNKYNEATLKARVFDIMYHEDKDIHDYPLKERINILFYQFSQHSSDDLGFPNKKNSKIADSISELEKHSKEIMKSRTSEGVVIKDMESTYYIGNKKNPKWIKWKKFVDLDVIVLDKKTTKSGLYSYSVGIGPLTGEETREHETSEIEGKSYLPVGKALNTKENVDVGSIVRVKVDEVKRKGKGYSLFSAKVIEIPEVEAPEKLITLELLSKDSKKSLAYDVQEALLKYTITDGIHGNAEIIMKGDYSGFTVFGFEGDSLMEKNALADMDSWEEQLDEINKTKSSEARGMIKNFLVNKDPNEEGIETKEIFEFIKKQKPEETNSLWNNNVRKLKNWMNDYDEFIPIGPNKFTYNKLHISKETPKESIGEYKMYMGKDKNINLVITYKDKTMGWTIDIEDSEDIFNLFGKAGKFPAEISENPDMDELLDKGSIELGVQKHGYHEYKLDGNRFKTRLHFRVVPVNEQKKWIVWTGYKQKMLDKEDDEDLWDINQDRFKKLTMQIE